MNIISDQKLATNLNNDNKKEYQAEFEKPQQKNNHNSNNKNTIFITTNKEKKIKKKIPIIHKFKIDPLQQQQNEKNQMEYRKFDLNSPADNNRYNNSRMNDFNYDHTLINFESPNLMPSFNTFDTLSEFTSDVLSHPNNNNYLFGDFHLQPMHSNHQYFESPNKNPFLSTSSGGIDNFNSNNNFDSISKYCSDSSSPSPMQSPISKNNPLMETNPNKKIKVNLAKKGRMVKKKKKNYKKKYFLGNTKNGREEFFIQYRILHIIIFINLKKKKKKNFLTKKKK